MSNNQSDGMGRYGLTRARKAVLSGFFAGLLVLGSAAGLFGQIVNQYGALAAGSWPTSWIAITSLNDGAITGAAEPELDFIGTDAYPGFYFAKQQIGGVDYIFFRIRVNYSGTVTNAPNDEPFNNGTIFVMIKGSDQYPSYAFAWDCQSADPAKHGLEMVALNAKSGTLWSDIRFKDVDSQSGQKVNPPRFRLWRHRRVYPNRG